MLFFFYNNLVKKLQSTVIKSVISDQNHIEKATVQRDPAYKQSHGFVSMPSLKAAAQFSGDMEVGPSDEATVSPMVNPEEQEMVRKKILDSQYKCFEKMNRQPPYNKTGRRRKRRRSPSRTSCSPHLTLLRHSAVLQPQLGWMAVLGRHAGGHLRLSKLPKLLCGL